MSIHYFIENVKKPKLKYRLISKWLKSIIIEHSKVPGNLSFIFCNDYYLFEINNKFLNHKYFTDIITFDYVEGTTISGDIYISVDRVSDNSVNFGVNLEDEFLRVISHGVLHLLKYNDHDEFEKEFMRKMETECISKYMSLENDGTI